MPDIGEYEVKKKLGQGAFGVVYQVKKKAAKAKKGAKAKRGTKAKNSELFAMKVVENSRKDAINEVKVLREVKHDNIIRYYKSFKRGNKLCIVMELAKRTLKDYVVQNASDPGIFVEENVVALLGKIPDISKLHPAFTFCRHCTV